MAGFSVHNSSPQSLERFLPDGTLEAHREAADERFQYANRGAKCLGLRNLAERQGFEPWVQVLARTTV